MRKITLYILIIFTLSALALVLILRSEPIRFNRVIVPQKFSISIPEFLSPTKDIDSLALLQYKNEKKEMFLLIYQEKDTSIQSIASAFKYFSDNFIAKTEHGKLIKYFSEKINNHNAFIGNVRGSVNETAVYYKLAVVESNNKYYELIFGVSNANQLSTDCEITSCIESMQFPF